ncbi:hypothetical protein POTOM_051387 [Populus tomentosa]|uniref:Uncharacterized protein n=1 Tax=Populus tomentosa TaxID=118781 RepID=A0A8X7Y5Z9_POPTO|nr:hypothetical protein POTOM_051387 [Populus tomentosa]
MGLRKNQNFAFPYGIGLLSSRSCGGLGSLAQLASSSFPAGTRARSSVWLELSRLETQIKLICTSTFLDGDKWVRTPLDFGSQELGGGHAHGFD